MESWLADSYPWLKALHIIAVIAWMAGMLYLPRLFVYHAGVTPGSEASEMLKVMERRLLRAIMNPSMIVVFVLGGLLLLVPGIVDWSAWWIYAKLVLVAALGAIHGLFARWRRFFAEDRNERPARFFRMMNEAPTVAMVAIVILVVIKP